jgi:amino acid adenylation domain-containing protein
MKLSPEQLARLSPAKRALLEKRISGELRAAPAATLRRQHARSAPLTRTQHGVWISEQHHGAGPLWNLSDAFRLTGALDAHHLRQALELSFQRHEALRSQVTRGVEPMLEVTDVALPFALIDLTAHPRAAVEREAQRLANQCAQVTIDMHRAPLLRVTLIRLDAQQHLLVLAVHHIVGDGWSFGALMAEIQHSYAALADGRVPQLPPLPIQFNDYALWFAAQRAAAADEVAAKARQVAALLSGAPPLVTFPTDASRPAVLPLQGALQRLVLPQPTVTAVHALARKLGVSSFTTLLAALQVLLSRCSGLQDVVVGAASGNREPPETEPLVGMFVNPLVYRTDVADDPSFAELARRVHATGVKLLGARTVAFEEVLTVLELPRDASHQPLFQVGFAFQNWPFSMQALGTVRLERVGVHSGTAKYDMHFVVEERDAAMELAIEYNTALYRADTIERLAEHYAVLLAGIAAAPQQRISRLPLLSAAQRAVICRQFGAAAVDAYPQAQRCLHELFEAQVERGPEAIALEWGSERLSYAQLNARANRLAHHLRALGVQPDSRVALCVERGIEMAVVILAVLKAGGAYVPLDPSHPPERLTGLLTDCAPRVLLVDRSAEHLVLPAGVQAVDLSDARAWQDAASSNPEPYARPEHLAYVIYTSGSTGTPKGVMVEHRHVARLFAAAEICGNFDATDVWPLFHFYGFDYSVWEMWGAWTHGGRLVIVPLHIARAPEEYLRFLSNVGATVLNQTPSAFARLLPALGPSFVHRLRYLIFGGETLDESLLQTWFAHPASRGVKVINVYGITETAVTTTFRVLQPADAESRSNSVGVPFPDLSIYILDQHGEPVPIGVSGEIHVGGAGVVRGYLHRAELTAQRFVANRFSDDPQARLYRTGDLGRWRADGSIEFLGRNDHQVKIRGFRIELGEIEAQLRAEPSIKDVAVLPREVDPGEQQLVAYFVGECSPEVLRASLASKLPQYMLPAAYVQLPVLPLTANGKLDRASLPLPVASAHAQRGYAAPRGAREQVVAELWQALLHVPRVGRHDHFFELGGHSLVAVTLLSRLREVLQIEVSLAQIFEHPVLSDLAATLGNAAAVLPPIVRAERTAQLPLSYAQQRFWFLAQLEATSAPYHVAGMLRFEGQLVREALVRALDTILARHEVLRTTFISGANGPVQHIADVQRLALTERDLRGVGDSAAALREESAREAIGAFDLTSGPLLRGRLLQLSDREHVLLLTLHHVVADGWSLEVLITELTALYTALVRKEEPRLAELPVQYADYALWQQQWLRGEIGAEQSEYWRHTLAGAPAVLELPTDRVRPPRQDHAGARVPVRLSRELTHALQVLSARHGVTLPMTLLACWAGLLARLANQAEVVIGTPVANRRRAELEGLIGCFINTLALRIDVSGEPTVAQLLARVKAVSIGAQSHQDLPFEQVVELVDPPRSAAHTPLFQVLFGWQQFAWQRAMEGCIALPQVQLSLLASERTTAQFDLWLDLWEAGAEIGGGLEYASALFDRATIERYLDYWQRLLSAMVADDAQVFERLELLSAAERQQLLLQWNATAHSYDPRCIHELFELQAARTPQSIAVTCAERQVSYAQLNQRANRLAHYLRTLGVGPERLVGVCLERSEELPVALLGILKAGGAFVPLDPAYPLQRLEYVLRDCAPLLVLTQRSLRERLPAATGMPLVNLEDVGTQIAACAADNLALRLAPSSLAYVIYTSGSTGQPKGVMAEHRNSVNFIEWARSTAAEIHSCTLFATSLNFDPCVHECFVPLALGGCVAIVENPLALLQQPVAATLLNSVPSVVRTLLDAGGIPPSTRVLSMCGEVLTQQLVEDIFAATAVEEVWNLYGTTENTIYSLRTRMPRATGFDASIGTPIDNTHVYIVDRHLQLVPFGVVGEVLIGGAGVARGYWRREALTAQRFVLDPFDVSATPGRVYRTGDLARRRADGRIELLGRSDDQVKINGCRIELGEITAQLHTHPAVNAARVLARGEPSQKQLIAYVIAQPPVPADELHVHLQRFLPQHMLPAAYVMLDAWPVTPNGKLDRNALPAPDVRSRTLRTHVAPEGELERGVAQIWQELLRVPRIGRHDHFFASGGHSLLAVTMLTRLRQQLQVDASLAGLFERPALSDFVAGLRADGTSRLPPIEPAAREGELLLSYAQQRLWFLSQLEGGSAAYHIAGGLWFNGILDRAALVRALDGILARHEVLRSRYRLGALGPWQCIVAEQRFELSECDLRALADIPAALDAAKIHEASQPFDLSSGPPLRGRLLQLSDQQHVLLITLHHIVADGWSLGVLLAELTTSYTAYACGTQPALRALPVQYLDFALWQRQWLQGAIGHEQAEYWRRTLRGAPMMLELPTDRPRPAQQDYAGASVPVRLSSELTRGLKALSTRHGVTLHMTLLAGWASLLARLSGQAEVVIGTPVANRRRAELEGLVGCFVNTLALRIDTSGSPTVAQLLTRVREVSVAAQSHQDLPFEQVVELLQPPRSAARTPLFQVMFAWQQFDWQRSLEQAVALPGLELSVLAGARSTAQFELTLMLAEVGEQIAGELEYASALFERATLERHVEYWQRLLGVMVSEQAGPLERADLLSAAQRRELIHERNATASSHDATRCIHELFEAQVARTPQAPALECAGRQLSYAALNQRANQLAHYLRTQGVGPERLVAVCLERSESLLVALLGILKAGGAYVPLDPAYPLQRLEYMLRDCTPQLLLTQQSLQARLPAVTEVPLICLEAIATQLDAAASENPAVTVTPCNLAYLFYTSGSTGQPKGVMIEHRNSVNLIEWGCRSQDARGAFDCTVFATSLSFDLAVYECFVPLSVGGCVAIVPNALALLEHPVPATLLNTVPSVMRAVLDAGALPPSTRIVNLAGEPLPRETVEDLFATSNVEEVWNLYGPTETTTYSTWLRMTRAQGFEGSIGVPLGNTQIYIVDEHLQLVPPGVVGEILIGGAGVARGYWRRAELTAERFLPDLFGDVAARVYRSGDLGRWLADGRIEFLGRSDDQIKLHGHRIELGEIEAQLRLHPAVRAAVVVARADAAERRLVAYVIAQAEVRAEELRAHLQSSLPQYMLPAAYVMLEQWPLTANGKLDRKALPAPDARALALDSYAAPEGAQECALAEIWQALLDVPRVGRHDNFFALGGHSLLAVQVLERLHSRGLRADLQALFTTGSLAELAHSLAETVPLDVVAPNRIALDCTHLTPHLLPLVRLSQSQIDAIVAAVPGGAANVQDIYPATPLQHGILFEWLREESVDRYLTSIALGFDSRARLENFLAALQVVVDRQDILRTALHWEGLRAPVQVVWRKAALQVEEVGLPPTGDAVRALRERYNLHTQRLDLRRAPLLRVLLARDSNRERWLLLVCAHHLVIDRMTMELSVRQISALLQQPATVVEAPLPFRSFAARAAASAARPEHAAFFSELLADIDAPTPPCCLPEPGATAAEIRWNVDPAVAARIHRCTTAAAVTPASFWHLCLAMLLARLSARQHAVFGSIVAGRMAGGAGVHQALGLFINTLPVRLDIGTHSAQRSLLATHRRLAQLLDHEHAALSVAQRCSKIPAPHPLFTALLNYRHSSPALLGDFSTGAIEYLYSDENTHYPLTVCIDVLNREFTVIVQTLGAAFSALRMRELLSAAADILLSALEERSPAALCGLADSLPVTAADMPIGHAAPRHTTAAEYRLPCGVVEEALASIWMDLLQVARVGRDDNFFALGGDSLSALSAVECARAAGLSLRLQDLLERQVLREIAAVCSAA